MLPNEDTYKGTQMQQTAWPVHLDDNTAATSTVDDNPEGL
jgi:hypothetical protein